MSRVVVIGGGATGLSAAFWSLREGASVTVVEKGIVGWEASGRNGGGATHAVSPLFAEEQRLWPMMDDLLGYPTEYQRQRVRIGLSRTQLDLILEGVNIARSQGFTAEELDNQALREPELRKRLSPLGAVPTGGTPQQMAATGAADILKWRRLVTERKMVVD